jgi:acetylglutamate kinase
MMQGSVVIKIGGNELDQPSFVDELAAVTADFHQRQPCVVVHGGGKAINNLLDRLMIKPVYDQGQRVTDVQTLEVVEMVLSGSINKALTHSFLQAGIEAVGISGVDLGLLQVEPWNAAMGRVGRVVRVRSDLLAAWLEQGLLPVISPISAGPEGRYNVNADHAAGAIAGALKAAEIVFLTNVPGVIVAETVLEELEPQQVQSLIADGSISGGMLPKVQAALDALDQGVPRARITNLPGLREGLGTTLLGNRSQEAI